MTYSSSSLSKAFYIEVSLEEQRLWLRRNRQVLFEAPVSTGKNGPGEISGSGCTPRGWHVIRAKIGADCPMNAVFVGRRLTGESYSDELHCRYPERDWILTRILWLSGLEPGRNRFGRVDTLRRYIYIHGCSAREPMGIPRSHGCIRMHNREVVELFDRVSVGTRVLILEEGGQKAQVFGEAAVEPTRGRIYSGSWSTRPAD
jgi:L,D-transpeptidase YbiS